LKFKAGPADRTWIIEASDPRPQTILQLKQGRLIVRRRTFLTTVPLLALPFARAEAASAAVVGYAVTLLDKPGLPADFANFPYVNPGAPKGGDVRLSAVGNFDSFNGFIVRGTPAGDIMRIYDTLLRENPDEASTAYCHLAKSVELAPDGSWVAFELRTEARFHDGKPVTADDVAWTFDTLRTKGRPYFRAYYGDIDHAAVESPTRVVFHLKQNHNRELPLILGQLSVLPRHWWEGRDFAAPLTDPPLGSGPYKVDEVEFGRRITYRRVPDYWAKDMPTTKGQHNFDTIRTEYFRDATVALEAFKAGQVDFRQENIAKQWATAYDFPAARRGLVRKEELRHHLPTGMQGYVMNTRRPIFKDWRVREAMNYAFDFEWCNANLFYNDYTRTTSYFSNSDLASSGIPQGDELALLMPFKDKLPPALFTQPYTLPKTDGSGNNRPNLMRALELLKQAGWQLRGGKQYDPQGNQASFEILLFEAAFERVSLPYVQWLSRLGVDARVRTVDPAQYQRLTDNYDFDMTVTVFGESDSPGNEQIGFWTSASASQPGGDNLAGVSDPVVDALVAKLVAAPDRQTLVTTTRALDRVLLWGWYVVPHWYQQAVRVAYWNRFARPERPVRTGLAFDSWWIDPQLAAATDQARQAGIR
jgi:microcin C transport system substrate-binding protein